MVRLVSLLILFLSLSSFAQKENVAVKCLKEKFNSVRSFSAKIEQYKDGKKLSFKGKFYYYKPDYYKIVFPEREIVSVADTIRNFEKKRKRVVITLKDESVPFFDIRKILFDLSGKFNYKIVSKNRKGLKYLLKVTPKDGGKSFSVGIDKNCFVRSIGFQTSGTGSMVFKFKQIVLNKVNKQKIFSVKIPRGWKVIDLR